MSFITLATGKTMIATYKGERDKMLASGYSSDILTLSETFSKSEVDQISAQTGCVSIRVYLGMDDNSNIRAIVVGVDSSDNDILGLIMEMGIRCPTYCPKASDLNS